jgi:hypothetical protein
MTDPVVTVALEQGSTVVRWYRTVADAAFPGGALLEASMRGVRASGWLTDIPAGWVDAAVRAHHTLRSDPLRDMTALATHRNDGPPNGPLVPVDHLAQARAEKGR